MDTPTIPDTPAPDGRPTRPSRDLSETIRALGAAPTLPAPPGAEPMLGRYRILEELGRGGMGVVFLAHDPELGRPLALKVLLSGEGAGAEEVERFHREAQAAARLAHPHVIATYDVGVADGKHYMTMEVVRGGSVAALRKARRRLPPHEAARLVREASEGVAFAHSRGIVHRDLKPENLLLDEAGRVKVSDFGLARILTDTGAQRLTRTGAIMGTPAYMSPEQAEGDVAVDVRSDVYSLGSILYDLVTGELPYSGGTPTEVVFRKISRDPVPPRKLLPQLPHDLETVIEKAMEREPARRYPSARELADDLGRFLEGEPIAARPISYLGRIRRRMWKNRGLWTAALLLAALATLSAGYAVWLHARKAEVLEAKQQAEAGEAGMKLALEKAQSVSRVLARWARLAPALRRIERESNRLQTAEELHRAVAAEWAEVERFLAETPADGASQATAKAFAGWAGLNSGRNETGLAWLREATAADADVPYGKLMEAVWCFSAYLQAQQLPVVQVTAAGLIFGPPPAETEAMTEVRVRMESLLADAARAKVWGKEGAADFAVALEGIGAMKSGDYARAEEKFSQALEAPDLRALATTLQFARSSARYLRMRFDAAAEDLDALREALAGSISLLSNAAMVKWGQAAERSCRGDDPRALLEGAAAEMTEALRLMPDAGWGYANRGTIYMQIGEAHAVRGVDPRDAYAASLNDLDRAIRFDSSPAWHWMNRGSVHVLRGEAEAARGGDPRPHYERALADLEQAQRRDPNLATVYLNLSKVWVRRGEDEMARGADPTTSLTEAIAQASRALERDASLVSAFLNRGGARVRLCERQAKFGIDAREGLASAVADANEALRLDPAVAEGYALRGMAALRVAEADGFQGDDPRPGFLRAIADLDEALKRNPSIAQLRSNRGVAHLKHGLADHARGGDPRESIRRAVADLDAALGQNPEDALGYNNRGAAHMCLGKATLAEPDGGRTAFQAALADLDEVLKRKPDMWQTWVLRGEILFILGEFARSAEAYDRSLTLGAGMHRVMAHLRDRSAARAARPDGLLSAAAGAGWDPELLAGDRAMQSGNRREAQPRYEKGLALLAEAAKAMPAEERKALSRDPGLRAVLRVAHFNLACCYAIAARDATPEQAAPLRDDAFTQLDKAIRFDWQDAMYVAQYGDLLSLREDPRWGAMLEKMMK